MIINFNDHQPSWEDDFQDIIETTIEEVYPGMEWQILAMHDSDLRVSALVLTDKYIMNFILDKQNREGKVDAYSLSVVNKALEQDND